MRDEQDAAQGLAVIQPGTARAAEIAKGAGSAIDDSLLQTASGADALDVANARVEASEARVAAATQAQADAERALLDAQAQAAAAADGDTAALDALTEASDRLTAAQAATAKATSDLKDAQTVQTATTEAKAAADAKAAESTTAAGDANKVTLASLAQNPAVLNAVTLASGAVGMDAVAVHSVKAAGDFQQANNRLATSAGETQANLAMVGDGVMKMAGQVGDSTDKLEKGMYLVESAGYHGANGLTVLKAAAEGAKAEGADMSEVANALTSALNAYGMSADQSVAMTNQMIAAVGAGKMTMQDFSSSLSNVLPVAAAAGISFDQVGGAVATMTAQGMSAQQATQDLANTIRSLQSPNSTAITEMQQLGLNVNDVSTQLGQKGLTGTLAELTGAITKQMGPAGTVLMDSFNKSQSAGQDLRIMLSKMSPDLAKLSKSYMDGSTSLADYTKETKALGGPRAAMAKQFMSLFDQSQGFNKQLTSGSPAAQTYTAALGKMLGGATGLNTALMLTGQHAATFQGNVKAVGDAAQHAGSDINGWSEIQSNFNQKMSEAHQTVNSMFIALGTALLPAVTKVLDAVIPMVQGIANWVSKNKDLAAALVGIGGGLATLLTSVLIGVKVFKTVKSTIDDIGTAFKVLKVVMMENPWILIATLAVTAIILIVTHWMRVSQFFEDLWHGIESVAKTVWGAITGFFSGVWEKIKKVFNDAITAVVGFFKDWYPLILGILSGGILLIPALIFKYWSQISQFVSGIFNDVFSFLRGIWGNITGFLLGAWHKIVDATRPIWQPIVHIIGDIFQILKDLVIIVVDGLAILLKAAWEGIVTAAKTSGNRSPRSSRACGTPCRARSRPRGARSPAGCSRSGTRPWRPGTRCGIRSCTRCSGCGTTSPACSAPRGIPSAGQCPTGSTRWSAGCPVSAARSCTPSVMWGRCCGTPARRSSTVFCRASRTRSTTSCTSSTASRTRSRPTRAHCPTTPFC
jgi:TP901 family phage tail tape measure protein